MNRTSRFLNVILMSATLAVPLSISIHASPTPQEENKKEKKADKAVEKARIYDAKHKDYHNWDDREDRAYHGYLEERHEEYRSYDTLKPDEQTKYWDWRHDHPDDRH